MKSRIQGIFHTTKQLLIINEQTARKQIHKNYVSISGINKNIRVANGKEHHTTLPLSLPG
jgi:hypothetical protein